MEPASSSLLSLAVSKMRSRWPLVIPSLALLLATLILHFGGLDLQVSGWFYDGGRHAWPLQDRGIWEMIDRFCIYPGVALGVAACVIAVHGLVWRLNAAPYRAALLIAGIFLLGPGLLVNGTMKPGFSRPRPREIQEFGGPKTYQPAFGFGEKLHFNSSFPSGHASIGFFLIAPAFVCGQSRFLQISLLLAGLTFGTLMSVSRIVQGGHFVSDVLWSLAVIYLVGWGLSAIDLWRDLQAAKRRVQPQQPILELPRRVA